MGAKQEILKLIQKISLQGIGVIFISSDLSELISICDRITVFRDGVTRGEFTADDITQENIMDMIAADPILDKEETGND